MPKSGMWWEDRSKMYGIVNHESGGKKWESKYSDSLQNSVKEVVVVDGVFISFDKTKIKKDFAYYYKSQNVPLTYKNIYNFKW